jgi:predicted nucleotidyltransferase
MLKGEQRKRVTLDVLVEFTTDAISLLKIIALKHNLEDELSVKVDVLHAPVPEKSRLIIRKTVPVYEKP